MNAHKVASSMKFVILICGHDRDWKYSVLLWKQPFFYFSLVVLLLHLLPFRGRQNKTRAGSVSSAKLGDKNTYKSGCFVNFSPLLFHFLRWQLLWTWFFSPPVAQLQCSPWRKSDCAPREWADQPLNTNLLCVLVVSHFCHVWQIIRLK